MDPEIIPLETAAKILNVPVDTLLKWNELNILKPTISTSGLAGYRPEQIRQFLDIGNQIPKQTESVRENEKSMKIGNQRLQVAPIVALVLSFTITTVTAQIILNKISDGEADKSKAVIANRISKSELKKDIDTSPVSDLDTSNLTYSQKSSMAAVTEVSDSVFDASGNIKGENDNTEVLANNLLAYGIMQGSNQVKQNTDTNLLLFVPITLFLLSLPYIFRRQPRKIPGLNGFENNDERILELNQKTDGAIVLSFQGQEYKVCKPELDSESDQFIERLLELVKPGMKEIEYDISNDQEINLSAPLSKLVTRLGFVGIKRDLFFPRTSKNMVLFRKYLTPEDLDAMNISLNQLPEELLAGN